MQATVHQIPKYQWSIGGRSVAYRSTCRPTIGPPLSVDISTNAWPICRSICWLTSNQYIGWYVYRHIGRVSVLKYIKISVAFRLTYWPIYRSSVGWSKYTRSKKIRPFSLKMLLKLIVEQKDDVGEIFWLTSSFTWNCFELFFQRSQDDTNPAFWLAIWTGKMDLPKHSGFSMFAPQEKVLF